MQITIAGFGSGALLFTPMVQMLSKHFAKMPEYIGPATDFALRNVDGKTFADVNGSAVEVVQALGSDIAKLSYSLPEGLYVVGSGSTGAAEALAVCAAGYFSIMLASALVMRAPHASFVPEGMAPAGGAAGGAPLPAPVKDITMPEAIR